MKAYKNTLNINIERNLLKVKKSYCNVIIEKAQQICIFYFILDLNSISILNKSEKKPSCDFIFSSRYCHANPLFLILTKNPYR
jgi:hypothetical protein